MQTVLPQKQCLNKAPMANYYEQNCSRDAKKCCHGPTTQHPTRTFMLFAHLRSSKKYLNHNTNSIDYWISINRLKSLFLYASEFFSMHDPIITTSPSLKTKKIFVYPSNLSFSPSGYLIKMEKTKLIEHFF